VTPAIAKTPGEIRVRGLTRRFGDKVALKPFATTIGPGGITGLLGPNGSGKSTFLRMLVGLVPPSAGEAHVDGIALEGDGVRIRRRVTYVPGETALYGELSGRRHLAWQLSGRGRSALARALELAATLGLPLDRRVRGYSHGMKRQLLFAGAMAPSVRVRILDEPTEGLDPTARARVLELLRADAAEGTTILLSSHHLGEVERACDRTLFLRSGELLDEGSARRLRERSGRMVRLRFDEPVPEAATIRLERESLVELVRASGEELTLLLPEEDPRRALVRLLELPSLPPPRTISYGELSLSELYRELYGREGV